MVWLLMIESSILTSINPVIHYKMMTTLLSFCKRRFNHFAPAYVVALLMIEMKCVINTGNSEAGLNTPLFHSRTTEFYQGKVFL